MPRWMKPEEQTPLVDVGDRIAIIVVERPSAKQRKTARLVILTATEDGWDCDDPTYRGYTVSDGVLWSEEADVCSIARVVCPEAF